jgi:Na+/H+ antiporter NhaA
MSLFVAGLAFPNAPELLSSAKLGIFLASAAAGAAGWLILRRVLPAPAK